MMLDLRKVILSKSYLDEFDSTVMNLSNLNVSLHENLATKLWCSLPKDSKHYILGRRRLLLLRRLRVPCNKESYFGKQLTKNNDLTQRRGPCCLGRSKGNSGGNKSNHAKSKS